MAQLAAQLIYGKSIIKNVYVHLPFCRQKCHFCAFPIHATGNDLPYSLMERYMKALKRQIQLSRKWNAPSQLSSLYMGGGTPSLHSPEQLQDLISLFKLADTTEVTLEVNPSELDLIPSLAQIGVNRISLGLQSFNENQLNLMNRKASNKALVEKALSLNRPSNLSVDFILDLCLEEKDWLEVANFLQIIKPDHITLYILEVNSGSKLFNQRKSFNWLPSQQKIVKAYMRASQFLAKLDYDHYEVSNWSKTKKTRSQHSSVYWQGNKDFLAYGMGASSLSWPLRVTRPATLSNYFRFVDQLQSGLVDLNLGIDVQDESSVRQHLEAILMSRIRLKEGISWKTIRQIAGQQIVSKFQVQLDKIEEQKANLVSWQGQNISLTSPEGFLLADEITNRLLLKLH